MAAQAFDERGAQASLGEGVDEQVQQGNELGVVEGFLAIVAEPVLELDFSEMQQSGFRIGGWVAIGLGRRRVYGGSCRGTMQGRQFFGGKAQRYASRLARYPPARDGA